ncbi:APC family permease [Sphingomonas segetis]|jgi:APA family basic amino acid/polyamine antiporter|uniref:APC family permease n=1 Tax=Sphingomonas segetis TaxID=1104779 RepID=UPI0012D2F95C|nr:amino acid permease [Sphingomonas segetis]
MTTTATHSHAQLLRVLGLAFGLAAVVGGMVGQGILRTPGIVAGAVASPELIMALWVAGALVAGLNALAYVELGTAIPCAGGPYDFARRAFGSGAGLAVGWAGWLVLIIANAYLATVVAEFLHRLGVWPNVGTPVIAVLVLALFWIVNWTGTRISGASQILFSAIKGVVLLGFVVLLFGHPGSSAAGPQVGPAGTVVGIAAIAAAMRVILSTYNGWQDAVYFCEELQNPERTLPRSMAIGIAGVAVLYVLVNAALLHVLAPAQMATSNLAAADAARVVLGSNGEIALTVFGVLSVAAITNLMTMKSARLSFALARQQLLPAKLTHVAASGTPRPALTTSVLLSGAFAATGTYEALVATSVALTVSMFIVVNAAAIQLRRKQPDLARPFRMPLFPIPAVLAIGVNSALLAALIYDDPLHSLEGFALVAAIALLYSIFGQSRKGAAAAAA